MAIAVVTTGSSLVLSVSTAAAAAPASLPPNVQTTAAVPVGKAADGAMAVVVAPNGQAAGTGPAAGIAPASASGCLNVDAWKNMYTTLGLLAYRWHHTKYYCWSGGRVTVNNMGYYVSDNNGFNVFQGLAASNDYYFTWGGLSSGGHYSMRQAAMQNCFYACLGTMYPWVSITVHGDGSWTYSAGS